MTQQNKSIRNNFTTPAFRLSYPVLDTPQAVMGNDAKKQFSITMLFPKKAVAEALKAAKHPARHWIAEDNCAGIYAEVQKIARANFGPEVDLKTLKLTKFRDGDKPREQSGKIDENAKGYIVVRAATGEKNKPQCLRQDKTIITDMNELYPGCWCRAIVTISTFLKPSRGVTMYLVGVQKLAEDMTFSTRPRAEDIFDEVAQEGTSAAPETPSDDMSFLNG